MVYVLISTITIFSLVCIAVTQTYTYDYSYGSNDKQYTRKITLKQGVLQGVIVELRNQALPAVEQYLGIPYAAAPVGELRFMPPGSAPSWYGTKQAERLGPVCPQKLPNPNKMEASRKEYFIRLVKYLLNQSEDCLYLNIYAPAQDPNRPYTKKYPVMVFIHGESFEWNSGNPYDGGVLAAYGDVIVITLNYRLGILGFLKVGLEETSGSNFGLVDIIAALFWVQENIAAFGGDPNSVTLFGHGTGAACISLLMLSPMALRDGNPLFNRAILMGGTALSDWALAGTSRHVTYQVAEALNCPTDELAACLRKKRLNELMEVAAITDDYTTRFGPIVDGRVIPSDPNKIMSRYNDFFRRFELLYGVTEIESIHLLNAVGLFGLLEQERDTELRKYLNTRCEYKPELYLAHTLATYTGTDNLSDQLQAEYTGHEPDRVSVARDTLLDILSDARSVAPIALMARYHAAVNPQSYFYVFGHTTASRQFIRNKTTHGEELPYVFGVPLDGPKFHFMDHYNNQERLFSEVVMTLWCNFAYSGDPNIHRKNDYLTLFRSSWKQYDIDWPEFDKKQERYLYLGIPPEVRQHYRSKEVSYWNEILPTLLANRSSMHFRPTTKPTNPYLRSPPRNLPPFFIGKISSGGNNAPKSKPFDTRFGTMIHETDEKQPEKNDINYGIVVTNQPQTKSGSTAMIVLIVVGGIFLFINVLLCVGLYYKCIKMKSRESSQKRTYEEAMEIREDQPKHDDDEYTENGCSIMKMISKSSKSEGTYEAVKVSEGSSKYKLARQMSASTIDPHTKVRDWIAHEIVQRCSPKFLRRPRQDIPIGPVNLPNNIKSNSLETSHVRTDSKGTSYSTLGRSPTRPVSPVEGDIQKSSSIPRPKAQKVSVAIDATPGARSPSVLRQQPIELTKSLDYSTNYPLDMPIRRSNTVDNFLDTKNPIDIRCSATNINLKSESCEIPTIVKIEHYHAKSRSDPVDTEIYGKKMKTFDPNGGDINVTSKEEDDNITPLTPEESLMTIKRRNFPKVLPDYPDRQQLAHKRRSMPVPNSMFMPIPENPPNSNSTKTLGRYPPPAPPPRSSSSLGIKPNSSPIIQSPVMLAEEPPIPKEPEITCNNLFVGPLLPTRENRKIELITTPKDSYMLDTQPIYDNLRSPREEETNKKTDKIPKTIITTDPINPIKKNEPKVVIKPVITRNTIDNRSKGITRVTAKDNVDEANSKIKSDESQIIKSTSTTSIDKTVDDTAAKVKSTSHIPKLIKCSNITKEDSPESSPSEESETGTIIKRV